MKGRGLGAMWPPELAMRKIVLWLRPPGWPLVPPRLRPRLKALGWFAIAAQVVFVASWVIAGALEPGYSHVENFVSELGADSGVGNPWIDRIGTVVWGAGFVALGAGTAITLRGRPWGRVAPALFVAAGLFLAVGGLLPLDCPVTFDAACHARAEAGDLSWLSAAHHYASVAFELTLVLTPFALARAEWPSRIAWLTLGCGIFGLAFYASALAVFGADAGPSGLMQRIGSAVIHEWALMIAVGLLVEASARWPTRPVQDTPFAALSERLGARRA